MRIPIHDVSFDAEATQAMGAAFDRACDSLRHCGLTAAAREIIAKRIIQVAKTGERDPVRLYDSSVSVS
jgi:hypothetical protein